MELPIQPVPVEAVAFLMRSSRAVSTQSVLWSVVLAGCATGALPPAPPEALNQFTSDSFAAHVRRLADPNMGGRMTGSAGNDLAAEYIAQQFRQAGLSPSGDGGTFFQAFTASYGGDIPARNVVGLLPSPNGPAATTLILSAHYDHLPSRRDASGREIVFPGADDNASGVSALILIASALSRTPDRRCAFVFASFGAEEIGFQGARGYLAHPVRPLERTAALVNLDQVGHVRGNRLLMLGALLNPIVFRALEHVGRDEKAGLKIFPVPTANTKHWSDQAPFAGAGLPTLFFHCGRTEEYHTPQDTADRVNCDGGAQAARLVFEVARALDQEFHLAPARKVGIPASAPAAKEKR